MQETLEVSEATRSVAARIATRRRGTVAGAQGIIEAAARRVVLSRAHEERFARIVITPGDLSASDLTD